jgi:hypothetical protein
MQKQLIFNEIDFIENCNFRLVFSQKALFLLENERFYL